MFVSWQFITRTVWMHAVETAEISRFLELSEGVSQPEALPRAGVDAAGWSLVRLRPIDSGLGVTLLSSNRFQYQNDFDRIPTWPQTYHLFMSSCCLCATFSLLGGLGRPWGALGYPEGPKSSLKTNQENHEAVYRGTAPPRHPGTAGTGAAPGNGPSTKSRSFFIEAQLLVAALQKSRSFSIEAQLLAAVFGRKSRTFFIEAELLHGKGLLCKITILLYRGKAPGHCLWAFYSTWPQSSGSWNRFGGFGRPVLCGTHGVGDATVAWSCARSWCYPTYGSGVGDMQYTTVQSTITTWNVWEKRIDSTQKVRASGWDAKKAKERHDILLWSAKWPLPWGKPFILIQSLPFCNILQCFPSRNTTRHRNACQISIFKMLEICTGRSGPLHGPVLLSFVEKVTGCLVKVS